MSQEYSFEKTISLIVPTDNQTLLHRIKEFSRVYAPGRSDDGDLWTTDGVDRIDLGYERDTIVLEIVDVFCLNGSDWIANYDTDAQIALSPLNNERTLLVIKSSPLFPWVNDVIDFVKEMWSETSPVSLSSLNDSNREETAQTLIEGRKAVISDERRKRMNLIKRHGLYELERNPYLSKRKLANLITRQEKNRIKSEIENEHPGWEASAIELEVEMKFESLYKCWSIEYSCVKNDWDLMRELGEVELWSSEQKKRKKRDNRNLAG